MNKFDLNCSENIPGLVICVYYFEKCMFALCLFPGNMSKRRLNLPDDTMFHATELCKETDFSEISSGNEDRTLLLGNIAGGSGAKGTVTGRSVRYTK